MIKYKFKITYIKGDVYLTHYEIHPFVKADLAYAYFRKLLVEFKVGGGSYYLCSWGVYDTDI